MRSKIFPCKETETEFQVDENGWITIDNGTNEYDYENPTISPDKDEHDTLAVGVGREIRSK